MVTEVVAIDIFDLAERLFLKVNDEGRDIMLVADYETTADVLKNLINYDCAEDGEFLSLISLELNDPEFSGYDGPYFMSIDDLGEIIIEKALNQKGEFYEIFADTVYIQKKYSEASGRIGLNETDIVFFSLDDDEFDCPDSHVDIIYDENKNIRGFEMNISKNDFNFDVALNSNAPGILEHDQVLDLVDIIISDFNEIILED